MKTNLFLVSCLLGSLSFANGILDNQCLDLKKNGTLQKSEDSYDCHERIESFTGSSATTRSPIGMTSFIEVTKDKGVIHAYEANSVDRFVDISTRFPNLNKTTLKNGNVVDQTLCNRDLHKYLPVTKVDNLTCITLTPELCQKFEDKLRERHLTTEDVKKCAEVNPANGLAVLEALNESWDDKAYAQLANNRYKEVRNFSNKLLTEKSAKDSSFNYNLSDTNPKTGAVKVADGISGIRLISRITQHCSDLFLQSTPEQIGPASAPKPMGTK